MIAILRLLPGLLLLATCLGVAPVAGGARELDVATLLTASTRGPSAQDEAGAIAELNDALVRELCRRIAMRCIVTPLPFAEILPGVETGRFQIGAGNVLRTPEREGRVRFSRLLWRSSSRLVATQKGIDRLRLPEDDWRLDRLPAGSRVAAERGTQQHRHLLRIAAATLLQPVAVDTVGDAVQALQQGRADAALMPVRSAYFALQRQTGGNLRFVGPALTDDGLGGTVHLIFPNGEEALARDVDAALEAMRNDGSFMRIVRRHLPYLSD